MMVRILCNWNMSYQATVTYQYLKILNMELDKIAMEYLVIMVIQIS